MNEKVFLLKMAYLFYILSGNFSLDMFLEDVNEEDMFDDFMPTSQVSHVSHISTSQASSTRASGANVVHSARVVSHTVQQSPSTSTPAFFNCRIGTLNVFLKQ
jgi:hypothetical protein